MKRTWFLGGLLAAIALLLAPAQAAASTISECQAAISTLTLQTQGTTFLRGDKGAKTESQLLFHLSKASAELDKADMRDALRQMDSYSTDLSRAVGSRTIAPGDAAFLQTGAHGVVACIQAIG
jgi:hypothetical protein